LVKRAGDCGVQFLWNTPVSGILPGGVRTSRGLVNAKWIVGADGSGSRVRRWSGLDANHARGLRHATRRHYLVTPWTEFVEIYWGERCQAYVTPLSSQEVCIVLTAADAPEADFGVALQNWPQLQERLAGAELSSRERGAVTFTHRLRHVVNGNVALLGDSSGGVDAITGEGAAVEVVDGTYEDAVARAAREANARCLVISDTSWPGYEEIPHWIVEGYSTILWEIEDELVRRGEPDPDILAVQFGVGALAAAAGDLRAREGHREGARARRGRRACWIRGMDRDIDIHGPSPALRHAHS